MKTTTLTAVTALALASVTAKAQTLTHGPFFGGVTSGGANIVLRTDLPASVKVRYGTGPAES